MLRVSFIRWAIWLILFEILLSRKLYLLSSEKLTSMIYPSMISRRMNSDLLLIFDCLNFSSNSSFSASFRYRCKLCFRSDSFISSFLSLRCFRDVSLYPFLRYMDFDYRWFSGGSRSFKSGARGYFPYKQKRVDFDKSKFAVSDALCPKVLCLLFRQTPYLGFARPCRHRAADQVSYCRFRHEIRWWKPPGSGLTGLV